MEELISRLFHNNLWFRAWNELYFTEPTNAHLKLALPLKCSKTTFKAFKIIANALRVYINRHLLCYCNEHEWERHQRVVDTHHLRLRVIHHRQQVLSSFSCFPPAEASRIAWPVTLSERKTSLLLIKCDLKTPAVWRPEGSELEEG